MSDTLWITPGFTDVVLNDPHNNKVEFLKYLPLSPSLPHSPVEVTLSDGNSCKVSYDTMVKGLNLSVRDQMAIVSVLPVGFIPDVPEGAIPRLCKPVGGHHK